MKGTSNWHSLNKDEVEKILNSNLLHGLSDAEAKSRLIKFGYNELIRAKKISPIRIFLSQFKSILIWILLIAIAISLIIGEEIDALVIFIIVMISSILGFVQEYRAERALDALRKMLSPTITVIRDSKEISIPTKEIVPGDIIVLKEGDKIPADARLIEAINLQVNEASLTGESVPVLKNVSTLPIETPLPDRRNMVFSGTEVVSGKGRAIVVATGMSTEFGKIAKFVTIAEKEESPLERRAKEIGKWFGIIALSITALLIFFGIIRGLSIMDIFLFSVALAVAAVPEALPAVVTGSLAIGMYRMARRNALVRKMPAVETLGSVTVICSDKTGTLTKGEMTVRKIYCLNNIIEVSGVGYEPKGDFKSNNPNIVKSEGFKLLMLSSLLCNDAELIHEGGGWKIKGDPTEGALVVAAIKAGFQQDEIRSSYPRIGEIPFSSERKLMTTIHSTPEGDRLICMKGASERVLDRCTYIYSEKGIEEITKDVKDRILKINDEMAKEALRVLAIAYRRVDEVDDNIEGNMIFLGLMGMLDPPREEALRAVEVCKQIGIKPIMITGDHKLTAMAVAKELGIYSEGDIVLTGEELEKMSEEDLEGIVEKVTVYARVSPEHKLKIVKAWKRRGQIVAMTGDGVNDAPALKQADIGVAMGITGTEVTKETADMVLADDNFATIVNAIELGRWIYDNIKKYLTYLLQANFIEVLILSLAVFMGYPTPLLPVHILYVNLATDGLPAIALGVSPPDPDIMRRPPRNPRESIFTKDVKSMILRTIIIGAPFIFWAFLFSLPSGIDLARSRIFTIFVLFELTLAISCRSLKYSIFETKPHKFLLLAIIWEILLLIILLSFPITRHALEIVEIDSYAIWLALILSMITLITMESSKVILRKINYLK
ncbi:MAG: cation-translocating P-type ATPase [Candidatus Methanomethyliaceae archaeon]|nr:cation-translocating P-type ATPase [Candidatus Methanomethyliaceae archaeon]MDW7971005.1 cation-translocating P-type ATPase [Nitrososphaerota archaeon]